MKFSSPRKYLSICILHVPTTCLAPNVLEVIVKLIYLDTTFRPGRLNCARINGHVFPDNMYRPSYPRPTQPINFHYPATPRRFISTYLSECAISTCLPYLTTERREFLTLSSVFVSSLQNRRNSTYLDLLRQCASL